MGPGRRSHTWGQVGSVGEACGDQVVLSGVACMLGRAPARAGLLKSMHVPSTRPEWEGS